MARLATELRRRFFTRGKSAFGGYVLYFLHGGIHLALLQTHRLCWHHGAGLFGGVGNDIS